MKTWNTFFTLVLAGTLWLGAAQLGGAATMVVQRITISLTGYTEMAPVTKGNTTTWGLQKVKVTDKWVISQLATSLNTYFSPSAQLVMVYVGDSHNIYVKDGEQFTSVSAFFPTYNASDSLVWPCKGVLSDNGTVTLTGTIYSSDYWEITVGGLDLVLHGMCTAKVKSVDSANDRYMTVSSTTTLAGSAGDAEVLSGTLKVSSSLVTQ